MIEIWKDIKNIKSGKKELREFGIVIGVFLIVIAAIALWRGKGTYPYLFFAGCLSIALGLFLYNALKPLQKLWMAFAVVIGFFMSRIILILLFYFVVTPIGLIARISGKDILDERLDRSCKSYWKLRSPEVKDKDSYTKQF